MALDNRELALLVWSALIFSYLIWKTRRGKALSQIIDALFSRPILAVLGLMACYVAACVWLPAMFGVWQWSNLKTTLIWTGGFALAALFNFQRIETGKSYFRTVAAEAVSINALLVFLISSYTFSIPVELTITALLLFLILISASSARNHSHQRVHNASNVLLASLALLMLGNSIYHIVTGLSGFATSHNAREFTIPILLTILFLPFLYGIYLYSGYERIFSSFNFTIKDPLLRRHAKCRLMTRFRLDIPGLEKWRRHVALFPPTNISDIDASIEEIIKVRKREKRPYRLRPVLGWLPNHANSFLESIGLRPDDYYRTHDGWQASSNYLDLGTDILSNNVAYYLEGEEFVVSKLRLVLNVRTPASTDQAYEAFTEIIRLLVKSAIPAALVDGEDLVISSDDVPLLANGYKLTLARIPWPRGIKGGHELVFILEVAKPGDKAVEHGQKTSRIKAGWPRLP